MISLDIISPLLIVCASELRAAELGTELGKGAENIPSRKLKQTDHMSFALGTLGIICG